MDGGHRADEPDIEIGVLGELEVRFDGRALSCGHARQRSVLAVLAVEADRVVPVDGLIDRVWGERAPRRARSVLRTYLAHLRQILDPAGAAIMRRDTGYVLAVNPGVVDLHRFRRLLASARADEHPPHALALVEEALALWRGEPLAELDTPWAHGMREQLWLDQLAAEADRIDWALACGRHRALIPELTARATAHPLDERAAGQLMLALYQDGQPADALEHYRRLRTRLAEELGTDPGAAVRRLHQRILTADPTLGALTEIVPPLTGVSPRTPTPRQLPASPRLFTGRKNELARLTTTVDSAGSQGGVMVISAIGGSGGIGKTWLAVCWAHLNIHRFPDGQLYVNLNGFDPTGQPLSPAVAMRGFLEALGVAPPAIPVDPQACAGLYRSLVAGRRMLIVLDNARDTEQVTPLLPGGSGCVVLVTSRNRLEGLVTTHGATPLALDVLTDDEASRLLTRYAGEERVAAGPAAAAELLKRCAGLPLAIGIIGARAATSPTLSLTALADQLRDQSGRLDTLSAGELATDLRAVFSGSYHALPADVARLFRLLGLAQLPEIGVAAAASLAGVPAGRIPGPLRELEAAHLVQQHAPGRYRMHDLIRLYAHERAQHEEHDQADTLRRLVDYYLHTAYTADRLLYPDRSPITLDSPVAGSQPEQLSDATAARAWFDAEYACLTIATQHAAQHGWDSALWQLVWSANTFRQHRGRVHDSFTAWLAAIPAVDRVGSAATQAAARLNLAQTLTDLGRFEEAQDHLGRGLVLAEAAADTRVLTRIHSCLAYTSTLQGNNREALAHAHDAFEQSRKSGSPMDKAFMLANLGWFQAQLGLYDDARASCETALTLNRELSQRDGEASTLDNLGYIAHHTGEFPAALRYYRQALDLTRETGNTYTEADILDHLGETHAALDQPAEAGQAWHAALDLFRAQHRLTEADRVQRRLRELPGADEPGAQP